MKDEEGNRIEFYMKQAQIYFEKKIFVHIIKNDDIFYNGLIVDIGSTFFFIDDIEEGRKLVFFQELKKDIVEFIPEKK